MINTLSFYRHDAHSAYAGTVLGRGGDFEVFHPGRHIAPMGWNQLLHARFHPQHGFMALTFLF